MAYNNPNSKCVTDCPILTYSTKLQYIIYKYNIKFSINFLSLRNFKVPHSRHEIPQMFPTYANTIQSTFTKRIISPKSMISESHNKISIRLLWKALHLLPQSSDKLLQHFVHSCSKNVSQSSLHPVVIFSCVARKVKFKCYSHNLNSQITLYTVKPHLMKNGEGNILHIKWFEPRQSVSFQY